jgi:hypothetical protein
MEKNERKTYAAPAIVYEGRIEARAGSPVGATDGEKDASTGFDPADLFGSDN